MPAGMMPTGMPVPASSAHTSRTVPSPPQTMTRSAPETAARSAMPVPGSSTVVYCHVGSDQPDSAAIEATSERNWPTSSTLIGLRITASRFSEAYTSGSGSVLAAIERGRGSMKARARKNTARPSSEPPITSVGKCRPSSTRSRQTSSHHADDDRDAEAAQARTTYEQDEQHDEERGEGRRRRRVARREAEVGVQAEGVLPVRPVATQPALEPRGRERGHRHHDDDQQGRPAVPAEEEDARQRRR